MTELFFQRGHQFQIGRHKPLLEALRQKPYTLFDSHWFEVIVKLCGGAKCRQRSIVTLTQRLKFPRANQIGFAVTSPSRGDDAGPDFCDVL